MKKDELKKAFDQEFEKINVSNELKSKTLESINASYIKKHSHIPYLKNFAAIFVVTMLCISIYFARNTQSNDFIFNTNKEETTLDIGSVENFSMPKEKQLLKSTTREASPQLYTSSTEGSQTTPAKNFFPSPSNLEMQNTDTILSDFSTIENAESKKAITSEDEFLKLYPNAEKLENGYKIYEDGKEILYVFKNGILENTITIE